MDDVVVLCWESPTTADARTRQIAEFLGATVTFVSLGASTANVDSVARIFHRCACLIASADTLARLADVIEGGAAALPALGRLARHVFVFGWRPSNEHESILTALSSGGLLRTEALRQEDSAFHVADDEPTWCGHFSGLSFGGVDTEVDHGFIAAAGRPDLKVLVRAGERPLLVRVTGRASSIFFSSCEDIADLDERVPSRPTLTRWFSRAVPLMMVLRGTLGNRLWHSDQPRACFIVDDPLLEHRYGFLDYRKLFETMRGTKFSFCIAFIPWNYRRSRRSVARLFSDDVAARSLCVHGCDHTSEEFGATDVKSLSDLARTGLQRMRLHEKRFGSPFDEVMVFPHGVFSSHALHALREAGYLAAVNSELSPVDLPGTLTLRDAFSVAIERYGEFPLFSRRYPADVAEFAFDLFLGKPAMAVEHHGYFRNGYDPLKAFVTRLNAIEPRLQWTNLDTICSRACLTRTADDGVIHVQFFTDRFSLRNTGSEPREYVLRCRVGLQSSPAMTLNGGPALWERDEDGFRLTVSLKGGEIAAIDTPSGVEGPERPFAQPASVQTARVLLRRVLSEFRENHVDTNWLLRGLVNGARRLRSARRTANPAVSSSNRPGSEEDGRTGT